MNMNATRRAIAALAGALLMTTTSVSWAAGPADAKAAQAAIAALQAKDERPDAAQARKLAAQGALLVDVRSQEEWDAGHAKGAIFMPWKEVDSQAPRLIPDKAAPIVAYCGSGTRAVFAANGLRQLGYTHVTAMTGGYKDFKAAGVAVDEPR